MTTRGSDLALDTNAAIAILKDQPSVRQITRSFQTTVLPVVALAELRFGALKSDRPEQNLANLRTLQSRCHVPSITAQTTEHYARIRYSLRLRGKPIPENDLWIAAQCIEASLPLFTFDKHFDHIDDLVLVR